MNEPFSLASGAPRYKGSILKGGSEMTNALTSAFAATLALGAWALAAPAASAMPRAFAPALPGLKVENTRWVCGPYRCFWEPRRHHHHHRHYGRGRW